MLSGVVGGNDRLDDDDGGHLIATIFKGSGNMDNLVRMSSNLNREEWKKLENEWANALNDGDEDRWRFRNFDNVPGGKLDE
ncbi:cytoplasmic protein [Bacillus mycoides]|uniref:Type VII secretion system protein EssD-like domain-containing protein n=1 Tax=Bacillus mycoides TaxID=1405 RepID=A0AAP8H0B5_BACMY|nr:DNA/RNA non-specific endonuclease [Bacillus mycoides]EEL96300.1 hypothetical protein bmyco0001_52940 [Bacillus mycoides DSM 2048]AJH18901.1 DNA/RNA non-specific endonuclease family protein [Bacillus mycoides]MBG9595350.1 cytoplasmic protein [Bacillus mycoides]MDR4902514.1 DNA/RNA non-specific endonuclease [Bacillus mycoides]MED1042256.1 DNA/RNA non-specific endonuclease [Bacillus mycoides]